MIAIDTNVLLRLFLRDDSGQTKQAFQVIRAAQKDGAALINPIVLAEFAWTLDRRLKLSRAAMAEYIQQVLNSDDLEVLFPEAANLALSAFRKGRADFPDYYLAAINAELGAKTTLTFDKAALDYAGFSPVP